MQFLKSQSSKMSLRWGCPMDPTEGGYMAPDLLAALMGCSPARTSRVEPLFV